MALTDKQKQSLYFPDETLREIMIQANRLDRSLSWTVQQAWRIARDEVRKFPSIPHGAVAVRERPPAAAPRAPATGEGPRPSAQVLEFLRGKFESSVES